MVEQWLMKEKKRAFKDEGRECQLIFLLLYPCWRLLGNGLVEASFGTVGSYRLGCHA
jgi:hypothetical protein